MIINIRGTNGAGKTSVYRKFIDDHPHEELFGPAPSMQPTRTYKKGIAFALEGGTYCVGRHQAGCDGIHPQEIIVELIEHYAQLGHVIFENVLIAGNRGRWELMARRLQHMNPTVWLVLDTPFATCLERVYSRRVQRASEGWKHRGSTIKENVIEQHYRRVHRNALAAAMAGIDVRLLDHRIAYEQTHDLLVRGGWECGHGLLLPDDPGPMAYTALPNDGGFERPNIARITARQLEKSAGPAIALTPKLATDVEPAGTVALAIEEGWDISSWE